MPDYKRTPYKFLTRGVSLRYPADLMPEGLYPALNNMEVNYLGELQVRAGLTLLNPSANPYPDPIHSLRVLQDPPTNSYGYIIGAGTALYTSASISPADTGYSGNPLSMVPMRPPQSPSPWMYIGDSLKFSKISALSGVASNVGISPPRTAPSFQRGAPNQIVIDDFQVPGGWVSSGTSSAPASDTRFNETISAITYDVGLTGWACIAASGGGTPNYQVGARTILTSGSGFETVEMREVFPAITATPPPTIASILYDSGTSGLCSITLDAIASEFIGLRPDALVALGGALEYCRVLSVALDVSGLVSFRCSTVNTHALGDGVTGIMSFRAYTIATYSVGDAISGDDLKVNTTVGIGQFYNDLSATPLNLSFLNGRAIQLEDYIHISIKVDVPADLDSLRLYLVLDPTPALPSVGSAYFYDVDVSTFATDSWQEVFFKVSDLEATGLGLSEVLNLRAVTGLMAVITCVTGPINVYFDSWWIGGTFGPDSRGLVPYTIYQRFRSSTSGAVSNPSPASVPIDLWREDGLLIPTLPSPADPQVDLIDFFSVGATLTSPRKIGTIPVTATQFDYTSTDASNAISEVLSFTNFQPFPLPDLPHTFVVEVSGTSVVWVSSTDGSKFNTNWQAGSQIIIEGIAYTLASPPPTDELLFLVENAGAHTSAEAPPDTVTAFLPEPTLGGQPLAYLWGPDPLTNVMFGVGTALAAGTLFWTNPGDPDSASDENSYEVTSPSEPLVAGFMFNGSSYVWSNLRLFRAIAQGQTDPITGITTVTYRTQEVPNFKGIFSPQSFCVGDLFWQVTSEGIYESGGGPPTSITDETLYPLFTHGGEPGSLTYGYYPINFNFPHLIRLFYTRGSLYFTYQDTLGTVICWKYDRTLPQPGWFCLSFTSISALVIYADEHTGTTATLLAGNTGQLLLMGIGTTDNGAAIAFDFTTQAVDFGDPRSQKLPLDYMIDLNPAGIDVTVDLYGNNLGTLINTKLVPSSAMANRQQIPVTSISATLDLYRNLGVTIHGSTSTGRPVFYEWEPNCLLQPYLALNFSNQYQSHRFITYGHIRDGWVMYISTSILTFTVTVDGTTPFSWTIPSSSGIPKKLYLMDSSITPPTCSAFIRKGKIFLYSCTSPSPFVLFTDETIVNAKEWGSTGPYLPFKPFVGQTA